MKRPYLGWVMILLGLALAFYPRSDFLLIGAAAMFLGTLVVVLRTLFPKSSA